MVKCAPLTHPTEGKQRFCCPDHFVRSTWNVVTVVLHLRSQVTSSFHVRKRPIYGIPAKTANMVHAFFYPHQQLKRGLPSSNCNLQSCNARCSTALSRRGLRACPCRTPAIVGRHPVARFSRHVLVRKIQQDLQEMFPNNCSNSTCNGNQCTVGEVWEGSRLTIQMGMPLFFSKQTEMD